MSRSSQRGKVLRYRALQQRRRLSAQVSAAVSNSGGSTAGPGPTQIPAAATSGAPAGVDAMPVDGLLKDIAHNVQTLLRTVGSSAGDPGLVSSLKTDLASLTDCIERIVTNLGTAAAGASLTMQTSVASTTDPQAAAVLQAVLSKMADDLQSINTVVGGLGSSIGRSLGNQIAGSLSQIGTVLSRVNVAVSGTIGVGDRSAFHAVQRSEQYLPGDRIDRQCARQFPARTPEQA